MRLFSDLAGRLLPRARAVAVRTPGAVLALAALMLALTPLFYLYVQLAPPWFRSDTLACGARAPSSFALSPSKRFHSKNSFE